ncbi:D-aminoacid aminotransferase-like PLP-dependent enzyme [Glarea lozoyensis ATCC 20868]|uniref:D-aminoacid aminotransferase-like PLP-dependent enzyme n=1 Tax=Glarea lozoyensis (strain ATCC 20868 / MF5171) TaxID=1116229 RepID=S3CQ29_GLAL2|nr:D-aminoacid aminotransferase-like PLP-dependent enzyme [Glarea lozoyensis ATCC 20868]EPE28602.1 D-aminoacid aminotransferase-like PLP-dependent enzyme [Glarea lozoyensis ATCC 20868]
MSDPSPPFQLFTSLRYDPLLLTSPQNLTHYSPPTTTPSPFYMLPLHRDRLLLAATHFSWPLAITLLTGPSGLTTLTNFLTTSLPTTSPTPLKLKILLSESGILTLETTPVPSVSLETLFPTRLPPPEPIRLKDIPQVSPLTGGVLTSSTLHGDPPTTNPFICTPDPQRTTPSSYSSYKTTSRAIYDDARTRINLLDYTSRREVLLVSTTGEIMEGSLTSPFFWRDGAWVTPSTESGGQIGTTRRWALERGLCEEGVVRVESLVEGEECWLGNGVRGFQWGKIKLEV